MKKTKKKKSIRKHQPRYYTREVEGRREFPIDMLRYDAAFPENEESTAIIAMTFDDGQRRDAMMSDQVFRVRLKSLTPFPNSGDRWRSFGWTIVGSGVGI